MNFRFSLISLVIFFSGIFLIPAIAQNSKSVPSKVSDSPITSGGKGGQIIRVTTLEGKGSGSLQKALWAKGPRIIVFEVGGVIDLQGKSLSITEPYVTIAGQTAPSPGITLIKGGLSIQTHDVIVQHLNIRPGEAGRAKKSGWEVDGISTYKAHHVIVDHCSCTWATDENLSASGPRFEGASPDEWRQNTSHHITFSNCIIAEGLAESTHAKGGHSKGTLLHDNASNIVIHHNLYACNTARNPLAKGGVRAIIVNNWISNPGSRAIECVLPESEWGDHARQSSQLTIVGNLLEHGGDTSKGLVLFRNRSRLTELWMNGNLTFDIKGAPLMEMTAGAGIIRQEKPAVLPASFRVLPVAEVKQHIVDNVGARPWDRDPIDQRIISDALAGTGRIIDSEQEVGGYPHPKATSAVFNPDAWDLASMKRR